MGHIPITSRPSTRRRRVRFSARASCCAWSRPSSWRPTRRRRARARQFLSFYLRLPNYANNWKRLGFSDADLTGDGSDRLIDATVAWGDERAIRARLDAHWQAGADHICVQALGTDGMPDERLLELLAPGR